MAALPRGSNHRWLRPVVVIGSDAEAARVATLLDHHPEHGFQVCGLVADPVLYFRVRSGTSIPAPRAAQSGPPNRGRETGATFAVVSAGWRGPRCLRKQLLRDLTVAGIHVQLSTGLPGISHRRLRGPPGRARAVLLFWNRFPLAGPQIDGQTSRRSDRGADRAAPHVACAGRRCRLRGTRRISGPIIFSQERVGRDGRRIRVYKLRRWSWTRIPAGAADGDNERTGPLFKVARTRTNRIGWILRARTSTSFRNCSTC